VAAEGGSQFTRFKKDLIIGNKTRTTIQATAAAPTSWLDSLREPLLWALSVTMKYISFIIGALFTVNVSANCPSEEAFQIDIKVSDVEQSESNHLPLKDLDISLPVKHADHMLVVFQLQYGEVSEFRIPLHYTQQNGIAYGGFSIAPHYLNSLELLIIYSGKCNVAILRSINT
jgi:hypothetical protein